MLCICNCFVISAVKGCLYSKEACPVSGMDVVKLIRALCMGGKDMSYRYRWVILGVAWMAYIVMYMQRFSIPPLSPFIKGDFHLTSTQVGMLMSANAIGYVVMQMPSGWLVDRIGVRWMLGIGEISAGILILGMFFVTSYNASLVILLLAGLGCGCLLTATTKAIMVWFPVRERATAMGLVEADIVKHRRDNRRYHSANTCPHSGLAPGLCHHWG